MKRRKTPQDTRLKNLNRQAKKLLIAKTRMFLNWKWRDWTRFTQIVARLVQAVSLPSIKMQPTGLASIKVKMVLLFTRAPRKPLKAKRVSRNLQLIRQSREPNWSRCEPWWDNSHYRFKLWHSSRVTIKKSLPFSNSTWFYKTDQMVALQFNILNHCNK